MGPASIASFITPEKKLNRNLVYDSRGIVNDLFVIFLLFRSFEAIYTSQTYSSWIASHGDRTGGTHYKNW